MCEKDKKNKTKTIVGKHFKDLTSPPPSIEVYVSTDLPVHYVPGIVQSTSQKKTKKKNKSDEQ